MKSSTGNIELCSDICGINCDSCEALRADADVRGGKVRSVELRCEVADEVDTADEKQDEGMPISQICRRIRGKMGEAGYPFDNKSAQRGQCQPLKDAAKFLAKQKKTAEKAKDGGRKTKRHHGSVIDQSAGEDFGFPG